MLKRRIGIKLSFTERRLWAVSYTNYSNVKNLLPAAPLLESDKLVGPDKEVDLRLWMFGLQNFKRVNRECWPGALEFPVIHNNPWNIFKGKSGHCQSVFGAA